MSLRISAFFIAVVALYFNATPLNAKEVSEDASSEDCDKTELMVNVRAHVNLMMDIMRQQTGQLKLRKLGYLKELHKNISKAFEASGCPELWNGTYTAEDRKAQFYQIMKEWKPTNFEKIPQDALELLREVEKFTWMAAKDHVFATCITTQTRNSLLDWIANECRPDKFTYKGDTGLNDFHVPNLVEDPELEINLHAIGTMLAHAYLKALDCGVGKNETEEARARVTFQFNPNICYAAADSFTSDACFNRLAHNCPIFVDCYDKYMKAFQEDAGSVLGSGDASLISRCLKKSTEHWGRKKPEGVPSHTTIVSRGLRLFNKVRKTDLTPLARPYIKTLMKATFRPDTCDCSIDKIIPEENGSEEEE